MIMRMRNMYLIRMWLLFILLFAGSCSFSETSDEDAFTRLEIDLTSLVNPFGVSLSEKRFIIVKNHFYGMDFVIRRDCK